MKRRWAWLRIIGCDLLAIWIIVLISACVGLTLNQFRENPLPLIYCSRVERIQLAVNKMTVQTTATHPSVRSEAFSSPAPSTSADAVPTSIEVHYLNLPGFQKIVEGKTKGIILDARPEIFYHLGHVPGAISLSREGFEADYARNRSFLEANKSTPIAVYCSGPDCEDSQIVADGLIKLSFTRVFAFKGGWRNWTAAHLPEQKVE